MGLAAVPGRQAAFREGLEQAVLYAKALGCPRYPTLSSPSMTSGLGPGMRTASSESQEPECIPPL
jgi:hydroxypyruvate isomerase